MGDGVVSWGFGMDMRGMRGRFVLMIGRYMECEILGTIRG